MVTEHQLLTDSFENVLQKRNTASLQVVAVLGSTLVPFFWLLDWFVLPEHVYTTLWLRLACTFYGVCLLLAFEYRPALIRREATFHSFVFPMTVAWSIAIMCWLDQGYESPYYAGLGLVILTAAALFSWRSWLNLIFNGLIYGFYMAPLCVGLIHIHHFSTFLSNQFFLLTTILITSVSQRHRLWHERGEYEAMQKQQELLQEVQALATTDALTGIKNRHHMETAGQLELHRCQRHGHALTVILLDIDHFKVVNDTYGHGVGDEVLQVAAQRLLDSTRQEDCVGRYGGEEFLMILPETTLQDAEAGIARRVRDTFEKVPIETSKGPLTVTVSMGVASATPQVGSLNEVIDWADAALYQAKRVGRNRIVAANSQACAS